MGKRKILFTIANSMTGGVEAILLNLLKNIDRNRYHSTIIVTHISGALHNEFIEHSDEVINISCGPTIHTQADKEHKLVENTNYINEHLRHHNYDIMHVINSFEGYISSEDFFGKVVFGIYGDYHSNHSFFQRRIDILKRSESDENSYIITDTPANLELFSKAILIPTGVDVPRVYERIERNSKKLIWIGRASGEKRVQMFIELMKKLPDYNAVMFLAGRINHYKFPNNIKTYQDVTDRLTITKELLSSSIYVNTSYMEGQPLSLIEAMKCKCIPVVPHLGGMPELIGDTGGVIRLDKKTSYTQRDLNNFVSEIHRFHRMMPLTMEKQRKLVKYKVRKHSIKYMVEKILGVYEK